MFAKNSDRSPNEPQVIEYRPAKDHESATLKATYITIEQVKHTYATLLSRPVWMWGAEMGVNEHGVCIGNEAVFTKGKYGKDGLTGMDLVRLGLERGDSAKASLEIILALLKKYGQGGNCGYDHDFYYDNAFLIMDCQEIYILETANKEWVYKKVEQGSISNRLSINKEGDCYSSGQAIDFEKKYKEPIYTKFSGSKERLGKTTAWLPKVNQVSDMMSALREHREKESPLCHGDVASPCMHAGGLVGDHTTSSMVVALGEKITVWVTGSSLPCISLFKPWVFGEALVAPVFAAGNIKEADAYWRYRDAFMRKTVGHILPSCFYEERDALESSWLKEVDSKKAYLQEQAFYKKWWDVDFGPLQAKKSFLKYWQKKNTCEPAQPMIAAE